MEFELGYHPSLIQDSLPTNFKVRIFVSGSYNMLQVPHFFR